MLNKLFNFFKGRHKDNSSSKSLDNLMNSFTNAGMALVIKKDMCCDRCKRDIVPEIKYCSNCFNSKSAAIPTIADYSSDLFGNLKPGLALDVLLYLWVVGERTKDEVETIKKRPSHEFDLETGCILPNWQKDGLHEVIQTPQGPFLLCGCSNTPSVEKLLDFSGRRLTGDLESRTQTLNGEHAMALLHEINNRYKNNHTTIECIHTIHNWINYKIMTTIAHEGENITFSSENRNANFAICKNAIQIMSLIKPIKEEYPTMVLFRKLQKLEETDNE